jgi:hypothetical protein
MKIGLSYSRCICDIVDGKVSIDDILVIISRTDFDPHDDAQWYEIWNGYRMRSGWSNPEWASYAEEDEAKFRGVSINLWDHGKLHQPRKFGAGVLRRQEIWLETVLPNEELEKNPIVKKAWENFQVVAGLTNTQLDKEYK